jgi:hypothetical protein
MKKDRDLGHRYERRYGGNPDRAVMVVVALLVAGVAIYALLRTL